MVIIWCLLWHYIKIEHDVVQENTLDFQTSVGTCHCWICVEQEAELIVINIFNGI